MASSRQLIIVAIIIAVALPAVAHATQYVVGDDNGWTLGFDYSTWTHGKVFLVGDTIVFKYEAEMHNVYRVTGPEFKNCSVPSAADASQPLTTGNDVITLSTPGRKWYLCGVGDGAHCEAGQKLFINVQPATWVAPSHEAPSPAPAMWWGASPPSDESTPAWTAPAPAPSGSRKWLIKS